MWPEITGSLWSIRPGNLTKEANKEVASACFGKLKWQWVH